MQGKYRRSRKLVPIDSLIPNPRTPRKHVERQLRHHLEAGVGSPRLVLEHDGGAAA